MINNMDLSFIFSSHPVQQTDFVKCRLANKLIDFIETTNPNK
jgi:hypothetical protein